MRSKLVVAFGGLKGSGKSTLGGSLITDWGFMPESFAAPIKAMAKLAFPQISDEQLYGDSARREEKIDGLDVTVRHVLQTLGTEWGRNIYPDVWVDSLFARIDKSAYPRFVITDCRFEAPAVRARGGHTILLTRGMLERPHPRAGTAQQPSRVRDVYEPMGELDCHPSEMAVLDSLLSDWSAIIDNTGSLSSALEELGVWALRQDIAADLKALKKAPKRPIS